MVLIFHIEVTKKFKYIHNEAKYTVVYIMLLGHHLKSAVVISRLQ